MQENNTQQKKLSKTTTEDILITFPYHQMGVPISVPLVSIVNCTPLYRIYRKKTDLFCFEYILSGTQYIVEDKKYKVSSGDCYIIYGNRKHLYYADKNDPPKKICICAYGNLISELLKAYGITQTVFHKSNVLPIFEDLISFAQQQPDYYSFCHRTAIAIHKLIDAISNDTEKSTFIPQYIVEAKNIIDKSAEKKLNLEAVCKQVGISKSQLIKGFKKYYKKTPYNYLVDIKIQTAKILLVNTNSTVKEIAYSLKFPDEYYFSNLFKKKVGVSPSRYNISSKE
ncbi:MAG: AraC family transcriptional regulator [Clostridia bacterium]|nr:AraC family transcriptional regulator [Clostridia bacterium]